MKNNKKYILFVSVMITLLILSIVSFLLLFKNINCHCCNRQPYTYDYTVRNLPFFNDLPITQPMPYYSSPSISFM